MTAVSFILAWAWVTAADGEQRDWRRQNWKAWLKRRNERQGGIIHNDLPEQLEAPPSNRLPPPRPRAPQTGVLLSRRLLWVHIPKTGSTFCLSLSHAQCPKQFERVLNASTSVHLHQGCARLQFWDDVDDACAVASVKDHGSLPLPLPPVYTTGPYRFTEAAAPLLVTVLREPLSRLISAFADGRHLVGLVSRVAPIYTQTSELKERIHFSSHRRSLRSSSFTLRSSLFALRSLYCPTDQQELVAQADLRAAMRNRSSTACRHIRRSRQPEHALCVEAASFGALLSPDLPFRAGAASGCAVKTLTGRGGCHAHFLLGGALTGQDVSAAALRLSDDFAFVGIFERWNETVQTLYGRLRALGHLIQREDLLLAPAPVELARTRSQSNKRELEAALAAEVTRVGGFEDPFDGPLYARAVHIFEGYVL
jgi:hypothetical protein